MSEEFFPEGYKLPKASGGFMNLEKGDNVFRALDKVVTGFEYWTDDNKPHRSQEPFTELLPNAKRRENKKTKEQEIVPPKHIWIIPVWNYENEDVEVLTINQKTVQEAILKLGQDPDWGNPMKYDIKVTREGDGFDTKYSVSPKPQKELDPTIAEAYEKNKEHIQKIIADTFA